MAVQQSSVPLFQRPNGLGNATYPSSSTDKLIRPHEPQQANSLPHMLTNHEVFTVAALANREARQGSNDETQFIKCAFYNIKV